MKSKLFRGLLIAVVVPLLFAGGFALTGLINDPNDVTIVTDTLVGDMDSTGIFPWAGPHMQVTVGPGYNDTSFFSQAGGRALGDSYTSRYYIRGWTTRARTQLVFQTPLWSYAAPFKGSNRPKANLAAAIVGTQVDSFTRWVVSDRSQIAAYTAGTGTWDSTRIDLVNLRNDFFQRIEFAPFYDIVKDDSLEVCGKNNRAKITVAQYKILR